MAGTPRRASAADPGDFDEVVPAHAPIRVDPELSHDGTPDVAWAVAPAELVESAERAPAFEAGGVEPAAAALEANTSRPSKLAFDEDAPLGSVTAIHAGAPPDWSDGAAPEDAAEDAPGAWPPVGDRGVVTWP
ncbi:MAG: hypothetical protein ABIZ72_02005, partial [Candidatus Limnocylindrales bacterium]